MSSNKIPVDAAILPDVKVPPITVDPPSYNDATSSGSAAVYGDGNLFTDRPTMSYTSSPEPYAPRKKGWSTGFFDCLVEPSSFGKALCCPCISYAQTRHRLHAPNTPAPVISTPCLGYCLVGSCFPGAEFIFGFLQRGDIRNRLAIDHMLPYGSSSSVASPGQAGRTRVLESMESAGGFLDDVWRHFFCSSCSLAQEDREVRKWERGISNGDRWGSDEELGPRGVDTTRDEEDINEEGINEEGINEEGINEEGERLLGYERGELRGLRG